MKNAYSVWSYTNPMMPLLGKGKRKYTYILYNLTNKC